MRGLEMKRDSESRSDKGNFFSCSVCETIIEIAWRAQRELAARRGIRSSQTSNSNPFSFFPSYRSPTTSSSACLASTAFRSRW